MALWFAAVLGLIQGLTEFIPVSSTAHLRIAPALFGQPDPGAAYTAVIQLGTLAAVLVYFGKDIWALVTGALREPQGPQAKQIGLIVIGTLPIVLFGLTLKSYITGPLRSLYVICATLFGVAIIMLAIERWRAKAPGSRLVGDLGWRDALLIGLAQSCALVPGVSRSGATICMALAIGLARPAAARFSFLMSIPAIGGAGLLEMRDAAKHLGGSWAQAAPSLLVGAAVAAVSGYIVIAWLIKFLAAKQMTGFAVYRMVAAAALLSLLASGVVAP